MRITIDTKQDSRDEIRKAIRLLHDLLESRGGSDHGSGNQSYSEPVREKSYEQQGGFFNMFDSSSSDTQSQSYSSPTPEQKEEERKEEKFEIYEY